MWVPFETGCRLLYNPCRGLTEFVYVSGRWGVELRAEGSGFPKIYSPFFKPSPAIVIMLYCGLAILGFGS